MSGLAFDTTPVGPAPAFDAAAVAAARPLALADDLAPAFLAHDAARAQRDRLLAGALCVTTGQQPGLLTGPLYTVYKALSVVALAAACEARLGRPVVPVFWVAGDDHDFAEANHLHLLTTDNTVERLVVRDRPHDAPMQPLYREPVGAGIAEVLRAIEVHTPPSEFRADVLAWIERHYQPDIDLAGAFAGALAELLGPHGLVVFRPTDPAAKRAMAPHLLRALEQAEPLDAALAARAEALAADGHPTPVHVGDAATLVMLETALGRDRLVRDGAGFSTRRGGEHVTRDALQQTAAEAPERLSPNVLLRPVVEAAILPTLAYVAGPGELAYLPQCAPVYDALGVTPQQAVARWSGRVIETRVAKVLEKYGISADALDQPEGHLERTLVRDAMPDEAEGALAALRETLAREYDRLREAAVGVDPTLRKPVEAARHHALQETRDLEKRLVSHLKQQNDILVQQLAKARQNLFPLGKPQERVFNVAPYLIRYGRGFLDQARSQADQWVSGLEPAPASP